MSQKSCIFKEGTQKSRNSCFLFRARKQLLFYTFKLQCNVLFISPSIQTTRLFFKPWQPSISPLHLRKTNKTNKINKTNSNQRICLILSSHRWPYQWFVHSPTCQQPNWLWLLFVVFSGFTFQCIKDNMKLGCTNKSYWVVLWLNKI